MREKCKCCRGDTDTRPARGSKLTLLSYRFATTVDGYHLSSEMQSCWLDNRATFRLSCEQRFFGVDGRCTSTLCSRSRCGAREAMTVGCKPTTLGLFDVFSSSFAIRTKREDVRGVQLQLWGVLPSEKRRRCRPGNVLSGKDSSV